MGRRGPKPRTEAADTKLKIDSLVEKFRGRLYAAWERHVDRALDQLDVLLAPTTIEEKPTKPAKVARKFREQPPTKVAPPVSVATKGKRKCRRCRQTGHRADRCPNVAASDDESEPPRAPKPISQKLQATYDMITRAQAGDHAAMAELVRKNSGLVHWVARRYGTWSSLPYEDMVQEGLIGLVKAIARFDVTRGLQFTTYTTHWIRHFIGRACENAGLIRLPVPSHQQLRRLAKAQKSAGQDASVDDLAQHSGIQVRSVQRLLDRATVTHPTTLPDVAAPPADVDNDEQQIAIAREHIAALPERLRRVMELRYSGDGMTLLEVGNVLGFSRERARQLETMALRILRAKFATEEGAAA